MNTFHEENLDELVASCGAGNLSSLQYFFEQYSMNIYNFPIRVFHLSEDDAGDFFIYAFERLKDGKKFKSYNRKSSFKTWFYTVLRNMLIDWKKTKHEVAFASAIKKNKEGSVYHTIEMEPDPRSQENLENQEDFNRIYRILGDLKLEQRVIFKLAYIFYLNLDKEEIEYLLQKSGLSQEELKIRIFKIRGELATKQEEDIILDSKLTYLHTKIKELEMKLNLDKMGTEDEGNLNKSVISAQISKKKQQRNNLLSKKTKSKVPIRTPFKDLTELMNIKETTLSLLLTRIIQKLEVLLKK